MPHSRTVKQSKCVKIEKFKDLTFNCRTERLTKKNKKNFQHLKFKEFTIQPVHNRNIVKLQKNPIARRQKSNNRNSDT